MACRAAFDTAPPGGLQDYNVRAEYLSIYLSTVQGVPTLAHSFAQVWCRQPARPIAPPARARGARARLVATLRSRIYCGHAVLRGKNSLSYSSKLDSLVGKAGLARLRGDMFEAESKGAAGEEPGMAPPPVRP